jgi:AcrR family transcriptional regulator
MTELSSMSATIAAAPARERVLEAALRCFAHAGVAGTTLDDIRRDSGASIGAIYHHFADKQDLAASVYADGLQRYQAAFLAELREPRGAEEGIRAIVAFHLSWCTRNRDLARYLLTQREAAGPVEERIGAANREFFAAVRGWWAPHAHYGALRDLDFDLVQALWLGPSQEYCRHWLAGRARRVPAAVARALADAAWHSLRRPEGDTS